MSAKKCARDGCGKTVYPLEELKCLDKSWHKQCFKCTVCGMALNMKNYKGYDKMPYCEPHYPKTVASVVSDTPEMRRIAENTKLQSNVKYHEDFEKMKGQKIQIADDPEVSRHLKNTQVISQAAYHGEVERKKHMDQTRPPLEDTARPHGAGNSIRSPSAAAVAATDNSATTTGGGTTPYSSRLTSAAGTVIYSSEQGGRVPAQTRPVGSIADYDPLNGQWGSVSSSRTAQQIASIVPPPSSHQQQQQSSAAVRQQQQQQQHQQQQQSPRNRGATNGTAPTGFTVRAIYDYTAADNDEVTFNEGDLIVNCQKVDDGWLTGTVQRTLQWGMLPANYVERVEQHKTGQHYLN